MATDSGFGPHAGSGAQLRLQLDGDDAEFAVSQILDMVGRERG